MHRLIPPTHEYHSSSITDWNKGATMVIAAILGPELLIVVIVLLCGVAVPIWAIVDPANRPAVAFYGAGSNKTAWIVVIVVAWLFELPHVKAAE
jgi:hypothetical protein